MSSRALAFANGRFELVRSLGEGGYGAVYEAYDRELQMRVALKQLSRVGADALLRFKREFRALADMRHPNVVRLYELFEEDGSWFFTMELLEGESFGAHVRPRLAAKGYDELRLRDSLRALGSALSAVHRAGLVHRDLKPDNVIVTPEGRVVLLDFGLVVHIVPTSSSEEYGLFGTADYMAPEQADGGTVAPAADWYAFGAMLYEALTGHLPFYGSAIEVLLQKRRALPTAPTTLIPALPEDLSDLCMRLLAIDPAARPTAAEILPVLRGRRDSVPPPPGSTPPLARSEPFGRDRELGQLRESFGSARQGPSRLCILEGDSGLGKSTLMHHFAGSVVEIDPSVLVLRGACYERETVPFKAFDGIIDALAFELGALPEEAYREFVPVQGNLLVRAFPVLERIALIADAGGRIPADPTAQRRLVFDGLVSLLRGLSLHAPLLICIDDLQWADTDSLALLHALLTSVDSPRCLFLATARPLHRFERALGSSLRAVLEASCTERLPLSAMDLDAARALTRNMAGERLNEAQVEAVVRESEGHPMFLAELVRTLIEQGPAHQQGASLDEAILRRVARLPLAARTFLQLLAVASTPLQRSLLRGALSLSGEELIQSLGELSTAHLVRAFGEGAVECYHDRVRESVLSALDPQTRAASHEKLARALEGQSPDAPARIGSHWLGAGEPKRAIAWLERAAVAAQEMFAFEQEAVLYAELLLLSAHAEPGRVHGWRVARGGALANAGRSADAALAYLSALEGGDATQAAALRQFAVQALLQAGEVDRGLSEMRTLFRQTDLAFSETTTRALLRIGVHRMVLKFSRYWVEPLPDAQVRASDLADLERLFDLARPLGWVDMMRGVELQNRHMRLALRARDARHLSLALAYEGAFIEASEGATALADRCLERAAELASRVGDPYLHAVVKGNSGLMAFFRLQLDKASELLTEAERIYREDCVGASGPLGVVRTNLLTTLLLQGENGSHAASAVEWLREAQDRGDNLAYTSLIVLGGGYNVQLTLGDVQSAEHLVDACIAGWPSQPFSPQHLGHIVSKVNIRRAQGGAGAHEYIEQRWHEVESSLLGRSGFTRGALLPIRAHCALDAALVARGDERTRLVTHAARQVKALSKLKTPSARVRERLLSAQVLIMRKEVEPAVAVLRALLASPEVEVLSLERAAGTYLLGRLLGGDEGKTLVASATSWAASKGFRDPLLPFRMTAPVVMELA